MTGPALAKDATPPLSKWVRMRLLLSTAVMCGLFLLVVMRAYVLQVRDAEQYHAMAEDQYLREVDLPAHRGRILDRIGTELAASAEVDSVFANPRLLRGEIDAPNSELLKGLAIALKMDRKELLRRFHGSHYFTWLKRRIPPDEARAVRELIGPAGLAVQGIGLLREPKRYYPNRGLAGPLLGWAGQDAGQEGIELSYDKWLRGSQAALPGLQDARGQRLLLSAPGDGTQDAGHDVVLTLDKFIQFRLEQALEEGVQNAHAKAGVAVAMDPRNGEILAMASVPSINPNDPSGARERGVRNRPVTDPFEPGSTMKPFSIGAAIEAGAVKVDQEWDCEGGKWKLGKATLHDAHPEGTLTTTQVLARSSNICTAKIARRAGRETVNAYLRKMGFGRRSGVDLPGERAGQLRPVSTWGEVNLATIAFGQGMTATPLQIATGLSAYANGGTLYRPHIVQKVLDKKGTVMLDVKPEGQRVVSEDVARTMRQMMRAVMQKKGTGEKLDIPGYPVAGKTGTAQKVDPLTKHYSPKYWASSFVGFAPYEDPRLLIYVMVDEPQGSHYGGEVAGPIFVKVMSAALPYLGVVPIVDKSAAPNKDPRKDKDKDKDKDRTQDRAQDKDREEARSEAAAPVVGGEADEAGGAGPEGEDGEAVDGSGKEGERILQADRVPDFRGLGLGDALVLAQRAKLRLEVSGSGRITSQVPPPGTPIRGPVCQVRLAPPQ